MSDPVVAGIARARRRRIIGGLVLAHFTALGGAPVGAQETITTDVDLGHQYAARGEHALAIDAWVRALDVAPVSLAPADAASVLNDLGGAYLAVDEPLLGLAAFADSLRLAAAGSTLAATAAVNALRALHEIDAGAEIGARLEETRRSVRALEPSARKAELLLALGELERAVAQSAGGRSTGDARLAEEAVALAERHTDAGLVAAAYGELALESAASGDFAEALEHTRRAALLAQRAGLRDQQYRFEWQLGRLLRENGRTDDAVRAYSAAVATLDSAAVAAATTRRGFRRYVLPLYEEYADLMLAATRGKSGEQVTETLRAVQRHLEALRLAEVRNYFENQCAVPTADIVPPAAERTVVVYPMAFADRLELLVSTAAELRQITVDVTAAELTAVANLLRAGIERSDSGDYSRHARALYDFIIAPLENLLAAAEPTTLVFVPDGPLRTIPLAVLQDGDEFLIERYAVATTPALSLVGALTRAPVSRVLVGGLIEPTAGFAGLPFVAEELRSIEREFPARVYADDAFVTATLEREIVAGGYSIVHMATHAQFEADYRRSFLLAHDDVITMDRLEGVMGSQRYTDRPVDLLVLSACRTAAGDERAALGLAGVAVKAGARSALASLWAVNDESTARLVGEFYRRLADGDSKAEALRGAQLLLRNDERHSHPNYWAPFLMIGDWR
jgi:CHAT domain-containing protein